MCMYACVCVHVPLCNRACVVQSIFAIGHEKKLAYVCKTLPSI